MLKKIEHNLIDEHLKKFLKTKKKQKTKIKKKTKTKQTLPAIYLTNELTWTQRCKRCGWTKNTLNIEMNDAFASTVQGFFFCTKLF